MKKTLGTETAVGFIKHLRVTIGGMSFDAPVRLQLERTKTGRKAVVMRSGKGQNDMLPVPEAGNRTGEYVYALPGGFSTVGKP